MGLQKFKAIFRREFLGYFQSWQGIVLIVVSLISMGILFSMFALGSEPKRSQFVLEDFWLQASGVVMVLGMFLGARLLAEEVQSRRMVLFESSPVTARQLVYPKALAAMAFLAVVLVNSIYIPLYVHSYGTIHWVQIVVGYFGLMLLGMAAIGIGAVASAISSNQLVAMTLGGGLLMVLTVAWLATRVMPSPWGEAVGYFALHNEHFDSFRRSIVRSQDVLYYFSLTLLTVEVAARIVQLRRVHA